MGIKPIAIPQTVKIEFKEDVIFVTGPLGKIAQPLASKNIAVKIDSSQIVFALKGDSKKDNALLGVLRGLIKNAVAGVTEGFKKELELHGLGYKAALEGKNLILQLGFSHPVVFAVPDGLKIVVDKQTIISITGVDKSFVGEVAAKIRSLRKPEPYNGTGIRYLGEHILRKVGKAAAGSGSAAGGGGKK
jgi:large subunit ribosomal protein L6